MQVCAENAQGLLRSAYMKLSMLNFGFLWPTYASSMGSTSVTGRLCANAAMARSACASTRAAVLRHRLQREKVCTMHVVSL